MINYTEKGSSLHNAVNEAGYYLIANTNDQAFDSDGNQSPEIDTAVQLIIDSYDPLPEAKAEAISRVKITASLKAAEIYPFIDGETDQAVGLYQFASDLYLSTIPAARENLSGGLLAFKNVHDAAVSAISDINAMTDWQLVNAYDAVGTPLWP